MHRSIIQRPNNRILRRHWCGKNKMVCYNGNHAARHLALQTNTLLSVGNHYIHGANIRRCGILSSRITAKRPESGQGRLNASTRRGISSSRSPLDTNFSQPTHTYNHPSHRPLEGVLVVALEQVISGPYCTRQLADLGARVIKIERPDTGDFVRYHDKRVLGKLCSHFVWTNRNKESLALDIKRSEHLQILKELIKRADVFVQNLVPGAAARMGLSFDELKKTNERLIMCEISGYGSDGPYKLKKAYDLLVQAEAGVISITGTPDEPCKVGCSIADIAAGMYAYSSIMAGLLQRQRTGKGCRIDVSMLESMVEWMGFPMYVRARVLRVDANHLQVICIC